MNRILNAAFAAILCVTATSLSAEPRLGGSAAALMDDNGGRSLDADATLTTDSWWSLGLGAGTTRSRSGVGTLDGTSKRATIGLQSNSVELRGYYRDWNAQPFENETLGARLSWTQSKVTLAAIAEWQAFDVDYSANPATAQQSTAHFSGNGQGASIRFAPSQWSFGADAVWYRHDSLTRYVQSQPTAVATSTPGGGLTSVALPLIGGPVSSVLPALTPSLLAVAPTLSGSVVTVNQSVLQRLISADVGREFGAAAVHLDWSAARDAITSMTTDSYSVNYRHAFAGRWSAGITLGASDSDYGSSNFGGLAISFNP